MRFSFIFTFTFVLSLFVTTACNQVMDYADEKSAYSYDFNVNGCATGEKNFSSRAEMCSALNNDLLNNNCAENERYTKFLSDCPDQTWQQVDETTSF